MKLRLASGYLFEGSVEDLKMLKKTNPEMFVDTSQHDNNSVSFLQTDTNNNTSTVTIIECDKKYKITSTNNQIVCCDCMRLFSIHALSCPFCGCPIIFVAKTYFERFQSSQIDTSKSLKMPLERKNISTDSAQEKRNNYIDKEVFNDYNNYYVEVKQGSHQCEDKSRPGTYRYENIVLKLYLIGENNYIVQSNAHNLRCPFCGSILSIHSYDCSRCGHTMHEICEKLYAESNITGHRFYITWRAIEEYPASERKREVYNAVRKFIVESLSYSVKNYFKNSINEIHLETLVLIYQKSLGIERVEKDIETEIHMERKRLRHFLVENSQGSSELKTKAQFHLDKAYKNNTLVDYDACKIYLACMLLLGKPTSMKYTKDMALYKIYGSMDVSGDTIYQTVQLSMKDTIESTDYLRGYHKECEHSCEKVYLKIPLLLSDGSLIIRTILGTYCDKCKKYFILDTEFKKILCEGRIQTQISFSEYGGNFNGMDLSPESLLRKCGYTVSSNVNLTAIHRQKLLKAIIENKLYTPAKIVAHFRFLISVNNNVTTRDMSRAISKWQEDIQYLQQHYS